MKQVYLTITLLCSGLYIPSHTLHAGVTCPCVSKDGGECCCAGRGVPCNCAETYAKQGSVCAECPCPKTNAPIAASNPLVEVSYGEVFDKTTILEIKAREIKDTTKRGHVLTELEGLNKVVTAALRNNPKLEDELMHLKEALADVNRELWEVEDKLRIKEADQEFDKEFIELARSVYLLNSERSYLKKIISEKLNSHIIEEKQYKG